MDVKALVHRRHELEPAPPVTHSWRAPTRWRARATWLTWLPKRLPALLIATDLAAVVTSWLVSTDGWATLVICCSTLVIALGAQNLYKSRLVLSLLDDLPQLAAGWLIAGAATVYLPTLVGVDARGNWTFLVAGTILLLAARGLAYGLVRHLRRVGTVAHRTLIIGTTESGQRLVEVLNRRPDFGLQPVGFLRKQSYSSDELSLPVLGSVVELQEVIRSCSISVAVLAYENIPDTDLVGLLRSCHRMRCELFLIPQFGEFHGMNRDTELLSGVPLVRLRRAAHRTIGWRAKRLLDIAVSLLALLILLPLLALIAAAVRLEGGRGVIFRQTRIGIDGREFSLMKFRSMRPESQSESATQWNIAHDNRVGRVGKVLRTSSLDELPQLINILRGDMSLVGPRPERPHFVREFNSLYPSYRSRERVPCGLTGWAQVHGLRGDTPIDERADFDNFYIEHWSLWLDVKIMLRTVVSVFKSPGA